MSLIKKKLTSNHLLWFFFLIYLISISFINIYCFRVFSPPEFVFVLLGLLFIFQLKTFRSNTIRINYIDVIIGILIVIYGIGAIRSWDENAIIECVGLIYLVALYVIVKWMMNTDHERTYIYLIYGLSIAGIITTILGVFGFIQACHEHLANAFAWYYLDYPYLGNIPRARGLMGTPEMMAHLLSISILLKLGSYKSKYLSGRWWNLIIVLEVLGLLLTSSKTIFILLLIMALFIFFKQKNLWIRALFGMISVILFSFYIIGTHFVFKSNVEHKETSGLIQKSVDQTLFSDAWDINTTNYFELKKLATAIGMSHPLFGIGGTSFNDYQKLNGLNVSEHSDIAYDPHCTYLGVFAAYGFPGLVICCGLFILLLIYAARAYQHTRSSDHLILFLLVLFLTIEGINTDILNFRLLWVIMALISVHAPMIKFSYSVLTTKPNDHVV